LHWLAWLPHALAVYANTAPLPPLRVRAAAWGGLYQQDGHRDGERRQGCEYTNCGFLHLPGLKLAFRQCWQHRWKHAIAFLVAPRNSWRPK
jgi:hypothetical protein